MPVKTGASHTVGYLLSVIVASLLSEHILTYIPPSQYISRRIGALLSRYADIPIAEEVAGMFLITGILIGIWGIGFHLYRY